MLLLMTLTAGYAVALAAGIYLVAIHRLAIWLIWCMNTGPLHSFPNSTFELMFILRKGHTIEKVIAF